MKKCPFCGVLVLGGDHRFGDHVHKYHREALYFVEASAQYRCVCGEAFDYLGPGPNILDHWNNAAESDGGMHAMLFKLRA